MNKILISALGIIFSSLMNRVTPSDRSKDITQLQMSLIYVKSIETFRLLYVSIFGLGLCLVFFLISIALIYTSVFLYAPWTAEAKMLFGLVTAVLLLAVLVVVLMKILNSQQWLKAFHADHLADELVNPTRSGGTA